MPLPNWSVANSVFRFFLFHCWVANIVFVYGPSLTLTLLSDFAASAPPPVIAVLRRFLFLLEKVAGLRINSYECVKCVLVAMYCKVWVYIFPTEVDSVFCSHKAIPMIPLNHAHTIIQHRYISPGTTRDAHLWLAVGVHRGHRAQQCLLLAGISRLTNAASDLRGRAHGRPQQPK